MIGVKTKLLIFGITGDLGRHRLIPALENIINTGDFDDLSIIGVSRSKVDKNDLFEKGAKKSLVAQKLSMVVMNLEKIDDYIKLKNDLSLSNDDQLLVYLAVPPQSVTQIVDFMGMAGLNTPNVKLLFEKPFGIDLESAKEMIIRTANFFNDAQIYRIDHYLAKEMAQNIVAFRSRNALFSHIWNNNFIESIEIVALEKIGIEGRTHLYEQTGALRDVVQGHLMQLLALTLMDIPDNYTWDMLPSLRLSALSQLSPADPEKVERAQYEGYRDEVKKPNSKVETLVALELNSNSPNWVGVPIKLMTGKALDEKTIEIRVHLKKTHNAQSNCLRFRIQPNEGVDIELFIKKPGYTQSLDTYHLTFNYPDDARLPDAYEQVIVDAISSHKSLFTGDGEVLQSWRILKPIQDHWSKTKDMPKLYPKGSDIYKVIA